MKYILMFATVVAILVPVLGCGDGIAHTRRERENRYREIIDNDFRQMTDDVDTFLLMDQRSHLSQWKID